MTASETTPGVANEFYKPEEATDFFRELEAGLRLLPDYRRLYGVYSHVFQKCIDQKINATRLNFSGTFAKTDYLLKEHQAPKTLVRAANHTRSRLRQREELTDDDLRENYLQDLRNLCRFIACVYEAEIPESLAARFPREEREQSRRELKSECMRVIIDSWDKDHIYVNAEDADGDLMKVDYRKTGFYNQGDWSYMEPLFYQNAQLNLVRPRWEDDVLYPELIILEPDYLVDISAIARCFTPYAESPYVNLMKRMEPSQATEATVLGNLAGQLLDETIHQRPGTHTYRQSVKDFFKDNAISLLEANPGGQFHTEAQRQKCNIQRALDDGMRKGNFQNFDSKDGLVEPSFFSEMLGIQGRMDYLQFDFKFLIEQKSGKGEFPYDNFVKPRHREEHYVQLLLYMALIRYNFREIYERNNEELHAFLLYSKYQESLEGLGFAPDLLFRALRIRNGIAWADMYLTKPDGYRLLDRLTPEQLNSKHLKGKLWDNYLHPQLKALLDPIHQASELEKAYYYRFLTFIANEHMMSKLGNKTKENSGFASKWHDSPEDKRLAGNIYDRLTLASPDEETEGEVKEVVLRFSETPDNDMSNFRTGDIVILYPYEQGKEPDARKAMIFRCTIKNITADEITLTLRAAQSDKRTFVRERQKQWAIEHDFMESSYGSLYRGMHAFLSAPKERRDLLLLQRKPETDESVTLKGDYGIFNELALRVKQARDLFLIIGPPGTGKTSYGMLYTVKEELLETGSSVLVMSYTNRAVDEICSKLMEEGIDFIRIGGEMSCGEAYRDHLLSEKVKGCDNIDMLRNTIVSTRVFVSTTTSMNSHLSLLKMKTFTLTVIDEASQILEPHLIGILSAHNNGVPAVRKIVMIGDHKQLPAVVQQTRQTSEVEEPILRDIQLTDCRLSLFERLLRTYRKDYNRDNEVSYLLRKQGRMHPDIALFPNEAFYGNMLEVVPLEHQKEELACTGKGLDGIADLLATRRIAFIATEAPETSPSDKVNQNEADIIAATVVKIHEMTAGDFDTEKTVGVIVPYRNQIATVRNTIDKYGIKALHDITIDTVERFQGSQRDYIIYGFTIQRYYQLNFLTSNDFEDFDGSIVDRKLNVAMTRARKHLIIVGNPGLLANNLTYHNLLEFIRSRHGYFEVNPKDFVSGHFEVPMPD
ncbi:MAG: AAA family ATPase [Prevotella sp.]|nr:AAA family ATPase [Prevotella sp.]